MTRVGIIGASGYTGAELLRLCAQHPAFDVVLATGDTQAGTKASALYPSLAGRYPELVFEEFDPARAAGLAFSGSVVKADSPYAGIISAAKKGRCDLIFMASHGRSGLSGLLLGSETHKVLTHSKIPVLVYR